MEERIEDNLLLASCILSWEIRTLILGLSEPGFSHSSPSISQGYVADSACILLCNDSYQDFKRSLLLVLGSSVVFMAGFACEKSYAFKSYFGDFFPPESRDITKVSWTVSFSNLVDCKTNDEFESK